MRTVSFPTVAGQWSPLVPSKALKPGKPLALTLDGVPIVAFRDAQGRLRVG